MNKWFVITFALIIFISIGCHSKPIKTTEISTGFYDCTGNDYLRITTYDDTRVRVEFNGISLPELDREESNFGVKYISETGPIVLWAQEETLLLERFGEIQAHGCHKKPVSSQISHQSTSNTFENITLPGESILDAWFRSPNSLNGYGYYLKYPSNLKIDQNRLNNTRFLYAGPNNEPPALTDGFTLNVILKSVSPDSTVLGYANDRIAKIKKVGGEILSEPQKTTFQDKEAVKWIIRSALGNSTNLIAIELGPETIVSISYSAVGPNKKIYTEILKRILKTVRFDRRTPSSNKIDLPLAMLTEAEDTPNRGCDNVVFVSQSVKKTSEPLDAALEKLFSIEKGSVHGYRNFLPQTTDTLSFSQTYKDDSKVKIYLKGKLSGLRGVCDKPRAGIQIEETARQITGADTVILFLNGSKTDLHPGGHGPLYKKQNEAMSENHLQ